MEGAARAAERKHERDLMSAHHGAAWTGAAYAGKLKPFSHYLADRPVQQSPDQILSAFMGLQDMGAPMTIEQIN